MTRIPTITRILFLSLIVSISAVAALGQTPQNSEEKKTETVRLKLNDGSYLTVDDAWETPQGIWYRQGGISHLASKERVKKIERSSPQEQQETEQEPLMAATAPPRQNGVYDKPAWIYLKGGARVEADSATESSEGVWYKRGPLAIFIERSRVDRIEPEEPETIANNAGAKERGWSTGSRGLDSLIKQNGTKYAVDPYLIFLVMEQESHFNPRVVSPKGARGLMQLMPGTAARFGVRRPHDPGQNVSGGTRYLKELLNRFNNRVDLVLASYNAGEGAVIRFGHKVPPYRETRNYVKRISYRYKSKTAKPKPSATGAANSNGAAGAK